ncbi:MerR family transcriptional regulator [Streptomyces aureoversilis]|uniref:MerR family transcriptional regulator n=1 Tax=Streptomyces aureoversilis TaxID=67277 RepID=A0ABV9ZXC3_9ACTN
MTDGLTIGQAAAFVGVTIKTVRHYHRHGLLEEPPRDRSGYRRYGSTELLRLVQVRTLAAAGVPLAEIGPLLEADAEQFAAALIDVEQRLTDRIEELIARRDKLHRLAEGDRALLPDRALALLDRMHGLGFPPEDVAASREGLVLARALAPEGVDDYLTALEHAFDDAPFIALIKRSGEATAWAPDDPRIEELVTAMAEAFLASPERLKIVTSFQACTEAAIRYRLISRFGNQSPAGARMADLLETKLRSAGVPIPRL